MKTFAFTLMLVALPIGALPGVARAQALAAPAENAARIDSAYSALKRGNYKTALPLFEELARAFPDSMDYQASYALCLYETGELAKSQAIYEKIMEVDRDNILALLSIARI